MRPYAMPTRRVFLAQLISLGQVASAASPLEISIGGETVTGLNRRWAEVVGDQPSFTIESIVATNDLVTPAASLPGADVIYIDSSHGEASRDPMVTTTIKAVLTGRSGVKRSAPSSAGPLRTLSDSAV